MFIFGKTRTVKGEEPKRDALSNIPPSLRAVYAMYTALTRNVSKIGRKIGPESRAIHLPAEVLCLHTVAIHRGEKISGTGAVAPCEPASGIRTEYDTRLGERLFDLPSSPNRAGEALPWVVVAVLGPK